MFTYLKKKTQNATMIRAKKESENHPIKSAEINILIPTYPKNMIQISFIITAIMTVIGIVIKRFPILSLFTISNFLAFCKGKEVCLCL